MTPRPGTSSHVTIVGRLGSRRDERSLPSGDEMVVFDLIVDRVPARGATKALHGAKVDTIPCRVLRATLRRKVLALEAGTAVEASGRLHRRFWRAGLTGGALASALEVEVDSIARQ